MTQQNEFAECDAKFTESKPDCMREYPFDACVPLLRLPMADAADGETAQACRSWFDGLTR